MADFDLVLRNHVDSHPGEKTSCAIMNQVAEIKQPSRYT